MLRMRKGTTIAERFEIEAVAGHGGMGTVYRARDSATGERVAVKLLHHSDLDAEARFEREAQALAALSHPNIVRYLGHGKAESGKSYLVMEWLEGESLADRLTAGALSIEESVEIARKLARALAIAHARNIVHRDLKPSNIFAPQGPAREVKLLDFGIAQISRATVLTRTGSILGTPGYMAPEQARGGGSVDARADIFSLGCVLFECLTGTPAFQGRHVMALLAKLLMEQPPSVTELRPEVPRPLASLVARMLEKEQALRPKDGASLLRILDELGSSPSVPTPSAPESITTLERRMISVVALVPARVEVVSASADTVQEERPSANVVAQVRWMAEPFGARVDELADGTVLAVLVGSGPATDTAAHAARVALRVRRVVPLSPLVLLMARAEEGEQVRVGDVLERAASLLVMAGPKETKTDAAAIVMDASTRALLDARFQVGEQDGYYCLNGESDAASSARTLLGKPTPFIGRERELSQLLSLLTESIEDSRATSVLVVGAAGIGKSRLRQELVKQLRERFPNIALAVGLGDSLSAGSPMSLVASCFRSTFGFARGEPIESQRKRLGAAVSAFVAEGKRKRVAEFLGELLSIPFPASESEELRAARQNAALMAEQIQSAYIEWNRGVARVRPAVLFLEDLQWGDGASIKLIDAVLRNLEDLPWNVVALGRPEVHTVFPRLWSERHGTEIRLSGLSRRASEALVRGVLGEEVAPDAVARVASRAGGNAFYLEELIRATAEGRGDALPETVLGMVEARLSALDTEARRLLRAGSVFGEAFWRGGVEALLGGGAQSPIGSDLFEQLVEAEILARQPTARFVREEEYAFRHSLLREGAYAMLTERDRKLGHRLAAEWLQAQGEPEPRVLAQHYDRGGEPLKAARYHYATAELAYEGSDYQAAIDLCDRALSSGTEEALLLADIWALRADAVFWKGGPADALASAERAFAYVRRGSRSDCRAVATAIAGALFSGQTQRFDALLERLLSTDPDPDATAMLTQSFNAALMCLVSTAQPVRIEQCIDRLDHLALRAGEDNAMVMAWVAYNRATEARTVKRDFQAALCYGRIAHAQFERAGARGFSSYCAIYVGQDYALLGHYEKADEQLIAAVRAAPLGSVAALLGTYFHAFALLGLGHLDRAYERVSSVIRAADERADTLLGILSRVMRADIELSRGRLDEAEADLQTVEEAVRALPYQGLLVADGLARIRLRQGNAVEAFRIASQAVEKAKEMKMSHHLRHVSLHLAYAEAGFATGHEEQARQVLLSLRDEIMRSAAKIEDVETKRAFLVCVAENARTLQLAAEEDRRVHRRIKP